MRKLLLIFIPSLMLAQNGRYTTLKVDTVGTSNNTHVQVKDTLIVGNALTATGLVELGTRGVSQQHLIQSNGTNTLTVYRGTSISVFPVQLALAENTADGTMANYGIVAAKIMKNANSLQSGMLTLGTYRSAVSKSGLLIDSLTNVALAPTTMPSTTGRLQIKGTNEGLNLIEGYQSSSATKVFDVDTLGDADMSGRPYAELYQNDTTYALTLTNQSQYYTLCKFNQSGLFNNVTHTDSTITISKAGVYKISGCFTLTVNNNHEEVHLVFFNGNTEIVKSEMETEMITSGDHYEFSLRCISSLAAADVIKVRAKNITSAGKVVTVVNANWGLEKIN